METIGKWPLHPACMELPWLDDAALSDLIQSIKEVGYKGEPIELVDGQVIDGKNRLRACLALDIEPPTKEVQLGDETPLEWVARKGVFRRHLSENQMLAFTAKLVLEKQERAKQRRQANLKRGTDAPQDKPEPEGSSVLQAIEETQLSASVRKVEDAIAIFQHGDVSLQEAFTDGRCSASAGATVARHTPKGAHSVYVDANAVGQQASMIRNSGKPSPTTADQLIKPLKRAVDEATFVAQHYDNSMKKLLAEPGWDYASRELLLEIVYGLSETFAEWKNELEECRKTWPAPTLSMSVDKDAKLSVSKSGSAVGKGKLKVAQPAGEKRKPIRKDGRRAKPRVAGVDATITGAKTAAKKPTVDLLRAKGGGR